MKVFDRYIYKGFIYNIFLGFIIFNFLIILVSQIYDLVKWVVNGKISFLGVIEYLIYITPLYFNYTIPLAIVFGTISFVGRLSSNFEIIAFNSFGIPNFFLFFRLLVLVFLISVFHLVFNESFSYKLVKKGFDIYYNLKKEDGGEYKGTVENFSIRLDFIDFYQYIYALKYIVDLNFMNDIVIIKIDRKKRDIIEYIEAKNAKLISDNLWILYDVHVKVYSNGNLDKEVYLNKITYNLFSSYLVNKKLRRKHREELNLFDLYYQLKKIKSNDNQNNEISNELKKDLLVKINLKFIFPLSSFFLFFLVFNFSIVPLRGSNYIGITVTILVAFFYYVFLMLSQVLANKGGVFILWLPNFLAIFLGGFFLFLENKKNV
jgi:lipopolysaccharide export LptBFGC system permease protein LptF